MYNPYDAYGPNESYKADAVMEFRNSRYLKPKAQPFVYARNVTGEEYMANLRRNARAAAERMNAQGKGE